MNRVHKVLIIGAGIGGLSTAIALRKLGIDVEIIEKNEEFNIHGVGIILHSNAIRALNELGVVEEIYKRGGRFKVTQICNAEGKIVHEVPSVKAGDFNTGFGIQRRELHHILHNHAINSGARIRMGITVSFIQNISGGKDGVYVEFSDNTSKIYDMVIGADGVKSSVRNMLFDSHNPKFVGEAVWRYSLKRPVAMPESSLQMYYGQKTKAGIVPMTEDTVYVFVVTEEPAKERKPENELHTLMKDALKEFGGLFSELRDQINDPKEVVYRPLVTLLVDDPWYRGNVLLIGDAAHATVPHLAMGAAIAIEDGLVLAELLKEDRSVQEVLEDFMKRRYERCKLVVDNSKTLVDWELLQFAGKLPEENNPNALIDQTFMKMAEPY